MLLTTKLLRPTPDSRAVRRPRLDSLLQPKQAKRLNLVVAPAGYGKTTLVSQWCSGNRAHTAWLSLDGQDNQVHQFWQYVIGAFEHSGLIGLEACKAQLSQLNGDDATPLITALLNRLTDTGEAWCLVLDDYHVIRKPALHRQLSWFIDYLPPEVLVTLTSRTEPPLPLARWRVRQQVQDIHPGLLAFSEDECRAFFQGTMALELSDSDIQTIFRKTEGWVAAMQLAALSGQNQAAASASGSVVRADNPLITDYVLTEVLQQLPADQVGFLLETACCPRLSAELCDAIRQTADSQEQLLHLLSQNLFLVPLDNDNHWFRYHDLFRQALLQRIQVSAPDHAKALELRTIEWFMNHGYVHEGLSLIVYRQDAEMLARALCEHGNNLIHGGYHLPVLSWLDLIPTDRLQWSPRLQMLRVWALFFANRVEGLEPLLTDTEDLLDRQVADSHPEAEGALALQSEISLIRSYLARTRNDDKHAADLTRQVLKDIDQIRIPLKSVTFYGLGLDYFGKGALDDAIEALKSAVHYGKLERKPSTALSSGGLLAWIQYNRGDITVALETTRQVRDWVDEHCTDFRHPLLISCWQNSALCEIYREKNQLTTAGSYLAPLLEHVSKGTEPGQHVVIQYARGHLAFSQGRYEEAIEALEDALATGQRRREHIVFEPPAAAALLARCYLACGHPRKARACLTPALEPAARNPLNREQNLISLARVQIAEDNSKAAINTLSPLRADTQKNAHHRHLVEILLVTAEAYLVDNQEDSADQALDEALERAEEAGFLRLFAEESPRLQARLAERPGLLQSGRWSGELLAMLRAEAAQAEDNTLMEPAQTGRSEAGSSSSLVEPLSQREQEVLSLIHQGLANKDIAERMSVAPATVKAHIRNLYSKLGVGRRTEALARARELKLLDNPA
ncbi:helix-turn-helix transcriptional regulator [Marinobacter fuscus]|uniref:Helix-turn-helix transcriptional regulator n=1 Tax=Marinobacter fuscus TaxID=2109942 RepID=A0A2T1K3S0_9GAMM|nr:LuxR C-terminal-related transcriptional regulator [Marinobacter fuscus]PSF04816.1 helix-turn-helix transcriptional regulator [Marinobacter fuscus]